MTTVALVLAAGEGTRLGLPAPKAMVLLGGRPMLEHSLEAIALSGQIDHTVVVVRRPNDPEAEASLAGLSGRFEIRSLVTGGETRQESVMLGLAVVDPRADVVVCHDAARPFASADLFRRVLRALADADGAIPVIPSPDTVKVVRDGMVARTIPRRAIGIAQTPQAFVAGPLREAHAIARASGMEVTDDAMLLESAGYRVAAVEGEPGNFKITTSEDLRRAEAVLAGRLEGSQA
jgi:2-C-methyl-D-erythritol 4-phosphate cytidylyltransferase